MKKIVFLYALIVSFSIVLSENLMLNNNKTLEEAQQIIKENVTPINNSVDEKPLKISDNEKIILSDKTIITTKTPETTTLTTSTSTTKAPETTTSTTTTPPPNTTTSAPPPSPTPTPTPFPKPSIGLWNTSCIMFQMAGQLNLTYETKDAKFAKTLYNIPKDANIHDAKCDNNNSQSMELNWGPLYNLNSLGINFLKDGNNFYLYSMYFEVQAVGINFPNAKENQTLHLIHNGITFKTPIQMSYHCTRLQSLKLTNTLDNTTTIATFDVSDLQLEAFRTKSQSKFSTALDCDSSDTPDIVPIAVGIALICLILIVLLSYLVARRRSTARGYMSF